MKALYPTVIYKWLMVNLGKSWKGKVKWAVDNFGGRSAYKMFVYDEDFRSAPARRSGRVALPQQLGGLMRASTFAKGKA